MHPKKLGTLCFYKKQASFKFISKASPLLHACKLWTHKETWSHGVMVSTQDSESCDPSSNLGETWSWKLFFFQEKKHCSKNSGALWSVENQHAPGETCRDSSVGRALDWRSKGPRFDPGSRHLFLHIPYKSGECHYFKKNLLELNNNLET